MDHIPCHIEAWDQLLYNHYLGYEFEMKPLTAWSEQDLIAARTYIGRELSERELQRREQEEPSTS